ncbi:ThiF family adenylyltransferase [Curvibacter sp. APW13]|uniref:tRNA threonylcarbamoyladenosine dehydratase n=1 Tax=Curvibacter sp. APW13 TaxID=3077236 RepID=UPI0028DE011B|nr:ThiF family adenylyltransferase [Curvibacter sp. APW13]MDT8991576.1 ThiF family adenylyltransferase [Curvibacter sp. APW13]
METAFDSARRFGGLDRLYGAGPAQSIRAAHVAVVGIGGVGSWAAESLARSGVGHITLIDLDHIAESNVNRQVHALDTTLGQAKVEAMAQRIALINPQAVVRCIDDFVTPENWPQILPADVDAVIDACDHAQAKYAMMCWSLRQKNMAFVSCGAAGGKRMAHAAQVQDLAGVTHDPLLSRLRYRLRREKKVSPTAASMRIACVFSREAVQKSQQVCDVQSDSSLNCHGYGSSVTVTAVFGMVAAGYVMEKIAARQKPGRNGAII